MTDYKRVNKTRRNRGYAFEKYITKAFIKKGYNAVRLGSPSTGLPDVLAVNENTVIAIECKSTMNRKRLYVPEDQILRCYQFVTMFPKYNMKVLLAFKFGKDIFIKQFDPSIPIADTRCTHFGEIYQENKKYHLREFSL